MTTFSGIETGGLLFDMDGVLISSIASVNRCWRQWAALYNIPNADTFDVPHGKRAIEIVQMLRPDIDPEAGLRVIEDLELADTADLKVLPGVRGLLEALPPQRWAVVTSATRRLMLARLEVAKLPIPAHIISGEMVDHGKPHPEPYRRGAALLGLAPEDCIVVEDAPSGVGSGRAAGCRVLGVLGTHVAEELAYATWIVPSLEDLRIVSTPHGLTLHLGAAAELGADAHTPINAAGNVGR